MAKQTKKEIQDGEPVIVGICRNQRALHDYEILDRIECGVVLVGTEVKSLREGKATLTESYATVERDEVWLIGAEIPEYTFGNRLNHKPKRQRKLLMRRSEITKFAAKADQQGFTLVPLRMYFKDGYAKIELAVARGKQSHDKRQTLKTAEAKREIDRAMSRKRRDI